MNPSFLFAALGILGAGELHAQTPRPIPGGGRILLAGEGVEVVAPSGKVTSVYDGRGDAFWDPGPHGGVIVKSFDPDATLEFRRIEGRWTRTGKWRIGPDYYARLSPDGCRVAYVVSRTDSEERFEIWIASRKQGHMFTIFPINPTKS